MSSFPINFYYGANKSCNTLVLNEHRNLSFWFDLPTAGKVFLSLILIVSVWIGLIGKYAVLKRITQTGIIAYPLNPLMFYHEIIYTAYRASLILTVFLLLVSGKSAESVVNRISRGLTGTDYGFCSLFFAFVILAKTSHVLGSWAVAAFRYKNIRRALNLNQRKIIAGWLISNN